MHDSESGKAGGALRQRGGWVSQEQADAIRLIDHFRHSEYQHLDLDALIDEYVQNFVAPLIALAGHRVPWRTSAPAMAGWPSRSHWAPMPTSR